MILLGAACLGGPITTARAAPTTSATASATAEALFREGRAAATRGDHATAAKLFAESDRLSPAPGTRLNLALAEERLGRLLAAWEHVRSAMDQLEPSDERRPIAAALFQRVDPRVPRLTLQGHLPPEAKITLDGLALDVASLGVPLPVEVGAHRVSVMAPGHQTRDFLRTVAEGERGQVMLALGEAAPSSSNTPRPAVPEKDSSLQSAWPRRLGWIALGVGVGSLVGAGVTGFLAIDKKDVVDKRCDAAGCDDAGVDAASSGRTFATLATILGAAGVGFSAAGVTVLLVVPSSGRSSASATGPSGASGGFVGASYGSSF